VNVDFGQRVASLDLDLFRHIEAELTDDDKRSLLAIQSAIREKRESFCYLEIGSHLGGSIQPYLLDSKCTAIISIDKRTNGHRDGRSINAALSDASTASMLNNLERISAADVAKLQTFDCDAAGVDPSELRARPSLCFIDGEHTESAVVADFNFCASVAEPRAIICFHNSNLIFNGLSRIVEQLEASGKQFAAYSLPTFVFVIELGGFGIHSDPEISWMLINNHKSYLPSMLSMKRYRDFYDSAAVRLMRDAMRPMRSLARVLRRNSHDR
jgi:hypothetical protein